MTYQRKKLIGGMTLVVYTIFYYWVVITVAMVRLPSLALPWHFLFYFLSVVIWFIPAAALIRWIQR